MRRRLFKLVWEILIGKHKNFMLLSIGDGDLMNVFLEKGYKVNTFYHKIHPYVADRIIKDLSKSEEELFFERLNFEVNAEEYYKKQKR